MTQPTKTRAECVEALKAYVDDVFVEEDLFHSIIAHLSADEDLEAERDKAIADLAVARGYLLHIAFIGPNEWAGRFASDALSRIKGAEE